MNKPLFPAITVNGQLIPAADVAAEAQNHTAPAGKPGIAWRKAARALVIRALLLQQAARLRLVPEPRPVGKAQIETDDEALIRAVVEAGVSPEPVSKASLRARYNGDRSQFRAPTLYEVAHILLAASPDDPDGRRKARQRAEAALAILIRTPEEFDRLAQSQSDCSSRDAGGRLGQIGPGDTVPEFEAALDALDKGAITPRPVETRFGFHIIRLDARATGAVLPFQAVASQLREKLEKAAWMRAAHKFTNTLAAAADITGVDLTDNLHDG